MGRLLVSVRGPNEAVEAARGGAHIADVEHPSSALGTPYPLNIKAARDRLDSEGFQDVPISTNIGEEQRMRSSACQAALGVAVAGANYVKCGFAGLDPKAAAYLGRSLVRTVKEWRPECRVYPAIFPEEEFAVSFDPLVDGPRLVEELRCDGLLIDTYYKGIGKGLLDYCNSDQLAQWVESIHDLGAEAWVAGGLSKDDLPQLWKIGVDVICVRGAASEQLGGLGRFGAVTSELVRQLVESING